MDKITRSQRITAGAVLLALCALWLSQIDGSRVTNDAAQTAQMAVNLQHYGVISLSEQPPVEPTMYREPLPALPVAAAAGVADAFLGPSHTMAYLAGERATYLKLVNVLWAALLCIATFFAARYLGGSFYLSLLAAVLAARPFSIPTRGISVNYLLTELPAAALLMLGSLMLVAALRQQRVASFAAAGLCFGLLTLTKASFLYISAGLIVLLGPLYVLQGGQGSRRTRSLRIAVALASFALIVVPWIYRNASTFGELQVSTRSGIALYSRALLNDMTPDEYRGTYYVWASPRWRALVGEMLGLSPEDLERGGRLQRLNEDRSSFATEDREAEASGRPEDTFTYYREARAERVKLTDYFERQGHPHPDLAADNALRQRGMERIIRDLPDNIALSVAMIWRGAPLMFPFFLFGLAYWIARRRYDMALFVLPAFALLVMHALLSILIGRYAEPAKPVAFVAGVILMVGILNAAAPGWSFRSRLLGGASRQSQSSLDRVNPRSLPRSASDNESEIV